MLIEASVNSAIMKNINVWQDIKDYEYWQSRGEYLNGLDDENFHQQPLSGSIEIAASFSDNV